MRIFKKQSHYIRRIKAPGIISELENIECTRNNEGTYRRRYALTAKQKQILKQFDIDEKYLDRSIKEYRY